jgi:glyoxylase-like metal-dependent hydrolase (beta-lactamase superfamily II)
MLSNDIFNVSPVIFTATHKKKLDGFAKFTLICFVVLMGVLPLAGHASDTGIPLDRSKYQGRTVLEDFTAAPCPKMARGLVQINDNLYRHTVDAGASVHSGLVLITKDGAIIIDPAMTCTAGWLKDEIKNRFGVKVAYVILTHAHADHISGAQIFQQDGAIVVANQRALEPIVGEKLNVAIPDRIFDKDMEIALGGEVVKLHQVAASHSDSMTMVLFPRQRALQCTDVCENKTMPYNDFLDFYYPGWIETLDWVIKQDVDVIDIGHYTPSNKEAIIAERKYMVDLHQQVLDLVRKGQSWDELYRNVKFSDEVRQWGYFDSMHTLNILGMYRWVSNHRRGVW